MGGKSKSSTEANTSTTTTNVQDIDTTTIGLEDVEFGVAGVTGNVSLNQISTDHGAVDAGRKIGEAAFDFGEDALDIVGEVSGRAIDRISDATDRSLDFGEDALDASFGFASSVVDSQAKLATQGFGTLAGAIDKASQATRSDTADTIQKLTKTAGIVVGVLVVGGIVAAVIVRRG